MVSFEFGTYCHRLEEVDPIGIDRLTCLKTDLASLKEFQRKHPRLHFSVAIKESQEAVEWKRSLSEITLLVHQGMHLAKECEKLKEMGFKVRLAIPCQIELLKPLQLGGLDVVFDLMAYDYNEAYRTSFHSLLYNGEAPSIHHTVAFLQGRGISLNRVNLGFSSQGRLFKSVHSGMTRGFGQVVSAKPLLVDVIDYLEHHPSATLYYTAFAGYLQSFIYNAENGDWISYDDFKTIQSKIQWAKSRQLHGVFIN